MPDGEATKTERAEATKFGGATPVFRVQNLRGSIEYYVNALGFKVNFEYPDFASVSRDLCGIFLCVGDQGNPGTWVWIGVEDVEVLLEAPRPKEPKSATSPRITLGRWLDMYGRVWRRTPDGKAILVKPGSRGKQASRKERGITATSGGPGSAGCCESNPGRNRVRPSP
jgi:catechol 2,3-dioxygenase-like lactoylglutathione lyase family enzyme